MDIISSHINADFDCLASMIAALKIYPEAKMIFSGSQEKNVRDYLNRNILDLPFIKLKSIDWNTINKVILVDTRSISRLGELGSHINKDTMQIDIYDHHPPSTDDIAGNIETIEDVGATTTLFTEILKARHIKISPEEATIMALGIYEDTGNFVFPSTKPRDLLAASYLIECGADLDLINQFTKKDITPDHVVMLNSLILGLERHLINGQEIFISTTSIEDYFSDLAVLAQKLDNMLDTSVLFLIVRMGDRMSLIARSRIDEIDVSTLAKEFGGGGHPSAASASIKELTMIQARERLLNLLKEHVHSHGTAKDIMSAPVWTVRSDDTIEKAAILMNNYSINNLPVEENEILKGIISRQIVDKAIQHQLSDHMVHEYMSTDIYPIEVNAPAKDAQNKLIAYNLRFMPVVDGKKVVGVITRTDILRYIHDEEPPGHILSKQLSENKTRKNVYSLLRERISDEILSLLSEIGETGDRYNMNVYVVGGFVRDLLLRVENSDIDIVIEGSILEFSRHLAVRLGGRVKIHKKFETAVVICPDGFKFDIATARTEYYPKPAALPKIEVSSIKQDLSRRDFTINALAISLNKNSFGTLLDFFGSQKDIKEKTIRVLHGLSFVEDPTRVFRAIRFESRFDFTIGKQTIHFIQTAVQHMLFNNLSGKRLMNELRHMLNEKNPLKSLIRMSELDVLKFIHTEINIDQCKPLFMRINEILLWSNYLHTNAIPRTWMVYFLGLTNFLNLEELKEVGFRFEIPKQLRALIEKTRLSERLVLTYLESPNNKLPSKIFRLLKPYHLETILFLMAKTQSNSVKRHISDYLIYYRWEKCFITGKDLISLGIPKGPIYQEIISHILDLQLDEIITTKEEAIEIIKEKYRTSPKYRV